MGENTLEINFLLCYGAETLLSVTPFPL